MARHLNDYYWAGESLNAEVPCLRDQIIVEDSDVDQSPQAKADRNRKREAVGRRCILGHDIFIQTASLRGPFGGSSGWVAPWIRIKASVDDLELSESARHHKEDANNCETDTNAGSGALTLETCAKIPVAEDLPHSYIDDDSVRYDADNEDDAEEIRDERLYSLHLLRRIDGSRVGHAFHFQNEPQLGTNDGNIHSALEKDYHKAVEDKSSETSGRKEKALSPSKRKRKREEGWLKGADALKRSRYEILEYSSPTHVAGALRESDRDFQNRSSLRISHLEASNGQEISLLLPKMTFSSPSPHIQTTDETSTLPSIFEGHDESSHASEESFRYRRINSKLRYQKSRPYTLETEKDVSVTGKEVIISEGDFEALQRANSTPYHSCSPLSDGNSTVLEIHKDASRRIKEDGKHQSRTTLRTKNLDTLSEFSVSSSPDPLSRDLQNVNCEQPTPRADQATRQKNTKSPSTIVAAEQNQSRIVTQANPALHKQVCSTQWSASRVMLQMPISSVSEDPIKIPTGLGLTQSPLSDLYLKQTEFPIAAGDAGKPSLAQGCQFDRKLSLLPESPIIDIAPVDMVHGLQQVNVLAIQPIKSEKITEASLPSDVIQPATLYSQDTPIFLDVQVPEDPNTLIQSPWTATIVGSQQPNLSLDQGSNDSRCVTNDNIIGRHPRDLSTSQLNPIAWNQKSGEESINGENDRAEEGCLEPFLPPFKQSTQSSDELEKASSWFPSTQILVNAATTNPWNSAFKKPERRSSGKQVSFDSILSGDPGDAINSSSPKQLKRMVSPPLPAGSLHLRQLDDPFHYRLKATRNIEVTEESRTSLIESPVNKIPALTPRAKAPSNSPAVVAMAEAFIVADQQNYRKKVGTEDKLVSTKTGGVENSVRPRAWATTEQQEHRSPSPFDASFSIAPNGKVTAVSIGTPAYDPEDNLHAVIEEMGSFLEGWDVESELKKAKGQNLEDGDDRKTIKKREYLSGISNR